MLDLAKEARSMATNPIQFEGLDHVVLRVANLERSLEFFVGALGMHVERIIEGVNFCHVRCGRNMIDLLEAAEDARPMPGRENVDHFCISVRGDIDDIHQFLKDKGVRIKAPPSETYGATGFGTSLYVFDPDGHTIELKTNYAQYPVKSTVEQALNASTRPRAGR
jgi:catechol 2,3-dioxygenase-like lactoylglutathione lyase family enzyme